MSATGVAPKDIQLSLADDDVSVADVLRVLGIDPTLTQVDGTDATSLASRRAAEVLGAGSVDEAAPTHRAASSSPAHGVGVDGDGNDPMVEVAVVAGLDAGSVAQFAPGRYRMAAPAAPSELLLAIDAPALPSEPRSWSLHGATIEVVDTGTRVFSIGRPVDPEPGRIGFVHRPPRLVTPVDVEPITVTPPPKEVSDAPALSWATLLAPIPIALLMAFFFRPLFALFAAMGPVIALARWYEGKRRFRRETAERKIAVAQMRMALRDEAEDQAEAVAALRWLNNPHVAELWRRARVRSVRLWERRPNTDGYMTATVGVGADLVDVVVGDGVLHDEVHEPLRRPVGVRAVPHLVDLSEHAGLGLHGSRRAALAVARSVVLQLATLHGPADLRIGVVCPPERDREWDFLKWLPHQSSSLTARTVAPLVSDLEPGPGARSSLPSFGRETEVGQVELIIVDDPSADVAAVHRVAGQAGRDVRFIALAPRATQLPAMCSSICELWDTDDADGGAVAELSTPHLQGRRVEICPTGVDPESAAAWARQLAPMRDPEVLEFGSDGDEAISLLQLVSFADSDELIRRWGQRRPDAPAAASVGIGDNGRFGIDLSEDGPHALVAGTTGSGKSEFLRTLVVAMATECPPDQLNFVLVDFKGGGAFDICDRLPHVAGLITDLDETMVVRAINSLRAELHRREHLFRELGVSDYETAACLATEPIARLVIVIDEFAALATDYSDLMASIIDLAARGRSLGMHLVLATQRPNGVVDQKIRANTNLRIALRVQDSFDSQDVIGVPDAAAIDRRAPGRAIVSIGGDTPVTVQTAYSGAPDVRAQKCTTSPLHLFDDVEIDPADAPVVDDDVDTEIDVLLEAITTACEARGHHARPLWPDPLPDQLDWIDLGTRVLSEQTSGRRSDGVPLALVDLPDQQCQLPWRWDPGAGALAVFGASATDAGKLLVSLGAALAESAGADDVHLYVVDGDAGSTAPLAGLAHTGAYVTVTETDRLERTIGYFEASLANRRAGGGDPAEADHPRLVLMIDNLAAMLGAYDDLAATTMVERLAAITRDGAPQGVHIAMTARTVRDIPHRLAQQVPHRLTLALADPAGYLTVGLKQRDVVPLPSMRAIDLATTRVLQLVEPPDIGDLMTDVPGDPARLPMPINTFPTYVGCGELPAAERRDGAIVIPVGIEQARLGVAELVLQPSEHALVVSPPGGGRSTAVMTLARQVERSGLDIASYVVAPAGSPLLSCGLATSRLTSADEIDAFAESMDDVVIFVDDASRLDDDTAAALERLTKAASPGVHIIAAAVPDFVRSMRAWTSQIRAGGTGLQIGGQPTDGDLLKVKLTKLAGLGQLPGRAHLVVRGRVQPVQVAAPELEALPS